MVRRRADEKLTDPSFASSLTILVMFILTLTASAVMVGQGNEGVMEDNQPPVADAGSDITGVLINDIVTLNGNGSSDEELENCTWFWNCTTHPFIQLTEANSSTPSFTVNVTDTISFSLTITDPQGMESEQTDDSVVDVIVDENRMPLAEIDSPEPSGIDGPFYPISSPIGFSANGSSDPDGRTLDYEWNTNRSSGTLSREKYFTSTLNDLGWHTISVNVSDPNGGYTIEEVEIKVREDPKPPRAALYLIPSRDIYSKTENITLDASLSSDPNNEETLNYTWITNLSGGKVLGYGELVTVQLDEGFHNLTLNITDSDGLSDEDSAFIEVRNNPPVAIIETVDIAYFMGRPTVNVSESATLSGSTSNDEDGDDLIFNWDMDDGSTQIGEVITHSWSEHGLKNVTLEVDDGSMYYHNSTTVLGIRVNSIPVAAMEDLPDTAEVGDELELAANGSGDEDGDDLEYRWDMDGDGQWDTSGSETTYTYMSEGEYTVTLEVSDGFASSVITHEIEVKLPNAKPVAAVANEFIDGEIIVRLDDGLGELELDASASYDPDDDTNSNGVIDEDEYSNLTYRWDTDIDEDTDGDGEEDNDADETGKRVRLNVDWNGVETIILNVSDPRGLTDSLEIKVRGNNPPHNLNIRILPETTVLAGATVSFQGSARDLDRGDERILEYHWDFGDGSTTSVPKANPRHEYDQEGTYDVKLTVSDGVHSSEITSSVKVIRMEEPTVSFPRNNSKVSGLIQIRGKIIEVKGYEVDRVEVSIDGGEWKLAEGTTSWSYDWNTANYADGAHDITVRYTVDDASPITTETELTVTVSNAAEGSGSNLTMIIIAIVILVVVLGAVYLIFIRKKKSRFEEFLPPPGPGPGAPGRPPTVPPGGLPGAPQRTALPPGDKPPEPPKPEKKEEPPKEPEEKKEVRIKCPACGRVFRSEDTGSRPLHITCKHCGANGTVDKLPGDEEPEDEEKAEEEQEEVPEEKPEPIPIVCPSCSGVFELTEVTDTARCPYCEAEGKLDPETIETLEERFGGGLGEEITVRCPSCKSSFQVREGMDEIKCPFCGTSGKPPSE